MKLTKINYNSAVFFGVITFLSTLIGGLLMAAFPQISAKLGTSVLTYRMALYTTVAQTISVYVGVLFAIFIYNLIAKQYPISWETSKK